MKTSTDKTQAHKKTQTEIYKGDIHSSSSAIPFQIGDFFLLHLISKNVEEVTIIIIIIIMIIWTVDKVDINYKQNQQRIF